MLVGKNHAGGRGSCWWGRIMLVGKDHVGGEESCWLWKIVSIPELWFRHRKNTFFAQNGSPSVRSQQKSQQTICQLAADLILWGFEGQRIGQCRDNAEKIQPNFLQAEALWMARTIILAEDHHFGRTACSCQNHMISLGNKEPPSNDHLNVTSGPFLTKFEN